VKFMKYFKGVGSYKSLGPLDQRNDRDSLHAQLMLFVLSVFLPDTVIVPLNRTWPLLVTSLPTRFLVLRLSQYHRCST
jgi:hypothetical protein